MGIGEELQKEGYVLEYACDEAGDHTRVWINREPDKAVRIEGLKIERTEP